MQSRKKVLIVESDEIAANAVAAMIYELNCEPHILQTGQSLAVVFIELEPDLVIIYRKLFLKNRQLFIEGNERLSDSRLIVTSSAYLDKERINELGADYFLQKPFTLSELKPGVSS